MEKILKRIIWTNESFKPKKILKWIIRTREYLGMNRKRSYKYFAPPSSKDAAWQNCMRKTPSSTVPHPTTHLRNFIRHPRRALWPLPSKSCSPSSLLLLKVFAIVFSFFFFFVVFLLLCVIAFCLGFMSHCYYVLWYI